MDEVNTSQNIQNAETGDFPENTAGSPVPSSELKSKKKEKNHTWHCRLDFGNRTRSYLCLYQRFRIFKSGT